MNSNLFGMVDQVVASRGTIFSGTFLSTFTAYITRLRGYYSIRDQETGYHMGQLPTAIHHLPQNSIEKMFHYHAVKQSFWEREYPVAWRDIDKGRGTDWTDNWLKNSNNNTVSSKIIQS